MQSWNMYIKHCVGVNHRMIVDNSMLPHPLGSHR